MPKLRDYKTGWAARSEQFGKALSLLNTKSVYKWSNPADFDARDCDINWLLSDACTEATQSLGEQIMIAAKRLLMDKWNTEKAEALTKAREEIAILEDNADAPRTATEAADGQKGPG